MNNFLTDAQKLKYAEFQEFVAQQVEPVAAAWDRAQHIPDSALKQLGQTGYLGATIPVEYGGQGWDTVTFGLLNEALGRGDSAYTGVLTVQSMISMALLKWGNAEQRNRWLPPLAKGEIIGAFALTEPGAGSDLNSMTTEFRRVEGGGLLLNGEKRWISCGQMAGVFLVFGKLDGKPVACLVPRASIGFEIEPITDLVGFRAAGLARLRFNGIELPESSIVGRPGFGFSHVAPVGLQYGRLSTAFSAVGLLRACFEESTRRASERKIGESRVGDFGMVQSLIAKMGTDLEAGGLLCLSACKAQDERSPDAFNKAFIAKYFTSKSVVKSASNAIQIHGAAGCHETSPVARYYRGSKIMEIIEGTTQVHEMVLSRNFVREALQKQRARIRSKVF